MPKKNAYLKWVQDEIGRWRRAERDTTMQFMLDTLEITLNDPEVMGKNALGEGKIEKVVKAWSKNYDEFYGVLSLDNPEADYLQEQLDARLRRIFKKRKLVPFKERYEWVKPQKY